MDTLNRVIYNANISQDDIFTIYNCGITHKNNCFYNSKTNSDVYIFEYVKSGKGVIVINEHVYTLKKGDMYIIPKKRNYEYFSDSIDPYERYWFYGNGKLFDALYRAYFDEELLIIANGYFNALFNDLFEFCNNNTTIDYEHIAILIHKFFILAKSKIVFKDSFIMKTKKGIASQIKSYICTNHQKPFSLATLSQVFSISKNQIINIFKRAYGLTPQLFSTLYKLDMAEEMLKRGMSNIVIADYLGYKSAKYFSKLFLKYKNMLPSKIRKNI